MDKQMLYNMLEIDYLKMFNREISYDIYENQDLYPNDWFLNQDYDFKSKILLEALKKNITIKETDLYATIIEGNRKNR